MQPIPFTTTRYRCPHCPRTGSSKARITEHMGRCWFNPEARGCMTCKHFTPRGYDWDDSCSEDIDLEGRKPCPTCWGMWEPGECTDPNHVGNGTEIKPGPIVGCDRWEPEP